MNISSKQIRSLQNAVSAGLRVLFRPVPVSAVEWANENYYLPKESSYQEGRWETLPFQVAIMNAMGSDDIREVNLIKSARVGYSKMLLGVISYFIQHKQRNGLIWQPTDSDAENFMKSHIEPTIRDVPGLLALAPWFGKKNRDNTLSMKRFSNGRGFWCLGGKAAKNYREKSVDFVSYDELAAFDEDIEKEGSPTFLGDKRIEGSVWPKSIRGSTPKIKGICQIERAARESEHLMRYHIKCPHCDGEQFLKWGDKETPFGFKWEGGQPKSVYYLCEHNACVVHQNEVNFADGRYICETTGMFTVDGLRWFNSTGMEIDPPDSVSFHIWTAYSPFTTWVQMVKEFHKTLGDPGKRKTFVNTTLGETWSEDIEAKTGAAPYCSAITLSLLGGTAGAVRRSLSAVGLPTTVVEWWQDQPRQAPYTFRIEVYSTQGVTEALYEQIRNLTDRAKNLRSHLSKIDVITDVGTEGAFHISGAVTAHVDIDIFAGEPNG